MSVTAFSFADGDSQSVGIQVLRYPDSKRFLRLLYAGYARFHQPGMQQIEIRDGKSRPASAGCRFCILAGTSLFAYMERNTCSPTVKFGPFRRFKFLRNALSTLADRDLQLLSICLLFDPDPDRHGLHPKRSVIQILPPFFLSFISNLTSHSR